MTWIRIIFSWLVFYALALAPVLLAENFLVELGLASLILVGVLALALYSEKVILLYLEAREMPALRRRKIGQLINNIFFKENLSPPKLYIYRSKQAKVFFLGIRKERVLVFSQGFLKKLTEQELKSLISYLISSNSMNVIRRKTWSLFFIIVLSRVVSKFHFLVSFLIPIKKVLNPIVLSAAFFVAPPLMFCCKMVFTRSEKKRLADKEAKLKEAEPILDSALFHLGKKDFELNFQNLAKFCALSTSKQKHQSMANILESLMVH